MRRFPFALVLTPALLLSVAGCHVTSHNNGKNDNVDIGTPFGSMQVKTNDNVATADVGITPYPGAVVEKKKDNGDDGAADVNMSFGSFHLGVKAVSYLSNDAPDKVMAFYKKDLARYGTVLQCNGDSTVGNATRTEQGLTCSDEHKGVHVDSGVQIGVNTDRKTSTELRTGSKQDQHIVKVEPHDSGTKIGLVALQLPGNLGFDDDKKTN